MQISTGNKTRTLTASDFDVLQEPAVCLDCKAPFTAYFLCGFTGVRQLRCDACVAVWEKRRAIELSTKKKVEPSRKWADVCPPLYADTVLERLPPANFAKAKEIQSWTKNPKGILLRGESGTGKTRCLVKLMERLWFEGNDVRMFFGQQFGRECASHFGQCRGEAWMNGLCAADIVLFDDIGKIVLTDRTERELFSLLDERIMYQRPVFVTSNSKGDQLSQGMREDIGEALTGRLRRFCECIGFT